MLLFVFHYFPHPPCCSNFLCLMYPCQMSYFSLTSFSTFLGGGGGGNNFLGSFLLMVPIIIHMKIKPTRPSKVSSYYPECYTNRRIARGQQDTKFCILVAHNVREGAIKDHNTEQDKESIRYTWA